MGYIIKTWTRLGNANFPAYVGGNDVHNSKCMADVFSTQEAAMEAAERKLPSRYEAGRLVQSVCGKDYEIIEA